MIASQEPICEELLEPLKAVGRQDLADLIQAKLKEPPPAADSH
jgi:hypothetical protein